MKRFIKETLTLVLTLLALTFSGIGVTPAYAATLTVTTVQDAGAGSLRQAIADAASDSTITFASSLTGKTIYLASTLTLSKNVTISGAGLASQITISGDTDKNGSGNVGVFHVNSGITVTLDSLIITKGSASSGGGIENSGTLNLTKSSVSGNSATFSGGGINSANGTLNITNSTISGNSAAAGGGIFSYNGLLNITNSTLSGNFATGEEYNAASGSGGGIYNQHGSMIITNSTLSGNITNNNGGGVFNFDNASANIYNTSIVFNAADGDADIEGGQAGGVYNSDVSGSVFNLRNSLISGNSVSGAPVYNDCAGTINSYGRNLIGALSVDTSGSCTVNAVIIYINDGWTQLNDLNLLGILQNNGGPTKTVPLLPGSNAIDGADPIQGCIDSSSIPIAKDQRGAARVTGANCDIGAYEYVPALLLKSIGAKDGWGLESSETSAVGGTLNGDSPTFRLGDNEARKQYRGILSFDSGPALPDTAVITKVTLMVKQQSVVGGGNPVNFFQGFVVDIRKGAFGTSALQVSDFQANANKSYGPTKLSAVGGWYSFNLTSAKPYINKLATGGGLTQIRLRFNLDDNNNAVANFLSLFSGNAGMASRPQLIVEYYVP
jgi:hypothetical protein